MRDARQFAVPAGRLSDALIALSEQAGISIAVGDPQLDTVRTHGVSGRFALPEALDRLLRGSGYGYVFVDARTVRLVRAARKAAPAAVPAGATRPPAAAVGQPIFVTATKQHLGLLDYPASVSVIRTDRAELARTGGDGTGLIVGKLPQLSTTNLGPGRNKVFIRGIADSSFNGASQATISQYLDEARLIYSAPDPDLALYDMARVEVLEGPQGTLYGAGTLGGIIRLTSNPPHLDKAELNVSAGLRLTEDGAPGSDVAVIGNIPLAKDRLALRAVLYRTLEGGYVDDLERGLKDVNRNKKAGGRLALRWRPDPAWTIDLSALAQDIDSRDGQYTIRGEPDLSRRSAIAQPFDNDYRLAALTVRHAGAGFRMVSATSYADHSVGSVFDATRQTAGARRLAFTEDIRVRLVSHETRFSGEWGGGGTWLAGFGALLNDEHIVRSLGAPEAPHLLTSITNTTWDVAAFTEASRPIMPGLTLTLGGRFSFVHQSSEFSGRMASDKYEPTRRQRRLLPSAALSWTGWPGVIVYGRVEQGYRPGGLQVAGSSGSRSADRFGADRIRTMEVGMRFGMEEGSRLSGSVAASLAHWSDMQADLVGLDGLPYIANIGSGRVRNLAVNLTWRPVAAFSVEAAGFLNSSNLNRPAPDFAEATDRDLPNIADKGWRLAGKYDRRLEWGRLTIDTGVRYVGESQLAVRAPFALAQGRYFDVFAGARVGLGAWGVSLDLRNLLNTRANTFAFGNPFSVAQGLQQTPMRPRSLRIGIDASF